MDINILSQWWSWLVIALLVLAAIGAFVYLNMRPSIAKLVAGFKQRSRLLNTSEKKMFAILSDALDGDYFVLVKVGVLEFIEPSIDVTKSQYRSIKQELMAERFDYAICKQDDLSVVAVVELEQFNRKSVRKGKQRKRDLVSALCNAVNLKLFHLDARQDYKSSDIMRLIIGKDKSDRSEASYGRVQAQAEASQSVLSEMTQTQSVHSEQLGLGSCPKCHSNLVTKLAVTGKHIGERFLMCRKYPYCDYRILLNEANLAKIRSDNKQGSGTNRKGFADWND